MATESQKLIEKFKNKSGQIISAVEKYKSVNGIIDKRYEKVIHFMKKYNVK